MEDNNEESNKNKLEEIDLISVLLIGLGSSGLALLALPIWEQTLEWAWIIFGGILIFIGIIYFLTKKEWKKDDISFVKAQPKVVLYFYFPASLLLFWFGIKKSGIFAMFSVYYMIGFWLVLLGWFIFMKRVGIRIE